MSFLIHQHKPRILQLVRYFIGVIVVSIGAAVGIKSGLGAGPYDAMLMTLSEKVGLPFWLCANLLQVLWMGILWRTGAKIGPGLIFHSLIFGPVISVAMAIIPNPANLVFEIAYMAAAVVLLAAGIRIYLTAAFVAGTLDQLFEKVGERGNWKPAKVRTVFDIAICAYAWMGGGPVGVGTLAVTFGVGPLLSAMDSGLIKPASWRGIGLGKRIIIRGARATKTTAGKLANHARRLSQSGDREAA